MDKNRPLAGHRLMGLKIIRRTAQRHRIRVFRPRGPLQPPGVMHGGAVMAWGEPWAGTDGVTELANMETRGKKHRQHIERQGQFVRGHIHKGDTAHAICVAAAFGPHQMCAEQTSPRRRQARRHRDGRTRSCSRRPSEARANVPTGCPRPATADRNPPQQWRCSPPPQAW